MAMLLFICLLSLYILLWTFSNYQINKWIYHQHQHTQNQSFSFHYSAIENLSWFPLIKKKIIDPKLIFFDQSNSSPIHWKSSKAILSSSFLHPLTFTMTIKSNQSVCLITTESQCFQFFSPTFKITFFYAIFKHDVRIKITSPAIDFSVPSPLYSSFMPFSLKDLRSELFLEKHKNSKSSFFSAKGSIASIFIQSPYESLNQIDTLHFAFYIKNENTPYDSIENVPAPYKTVKILLQDFSFQLATLAFKMNGTLYFNDGKFNSATGDLPLYISGVDQFVKQNIAVIKCCTKLKENLLRLPIPSHLTLPFSFKEGEPYLGIVPLIFFFKIERY